MMNLCEYGCGQKAIHTFASGRKACANNQARCPANMAKRQKKSKETCLERYGVENPGASKQARVKCKATMIKRYGVEYAMQNKDVLQKAKNTTLKNYGVERPLQSEELRERYQETCQERYGYDNAYQSPEIQQRFKDTMIERYGVKSPQQSSIIRKKTIQTNQGRYGGNSPANSGDVREKMKETMLEKYGVCNPMQNPESFSKHQKSSFSKKEYIFPSGRIAFVMGYEPQALNILLETYTGDDIIVEQEHIPTIWYKTSDDVEHRYYPDIYIPLENLIIEIKSTWTYEKELERNMLKEQATINAGYNFKFMIIGR